MKNKSNDYVIRILDSPLAVNTGEWNALLATQSQDGILNPFMRHEYLAALHASGSATLKTGWTPRFVTLWQGDTLVGACALYLKAHSYGEYVFDWAWANAYAQNGLDYYPKALVAVPFTPVPGARLLARDHAERALLVQALVAWCDEQKLSSLHVLFAADDDVKACEDAGLMLRHTVQFHWTNSAPTLAAAHSALPPESEFLRPPLGENRDGGLCEPESGFSCRPFASFDDFLMTLSQEKRKKIRQERRKVRDAGITFRWSLGPQISSADWDFFYRCYERTYLEHGNAPYLSRDFFHRMENSMPENWLLFVAEHEGTPIASSLIAVSARPDCAIGIIDAKNFAAEPESAGNTSFQGLTAYGRYWGALARVDCLHFEACYYQPIEWCIAHGFQSFEGGAQGEHKMARALLPVKTTSAHWLAHPSFADAIERFLEREGAGIDHYLEDLERRSPFKAAVVQPPTNPTIPS
ncbi:GNAT family N-acetyltransferase [Polaromonas sp. CG_9.11]|uniref:GNAT family N-acetyltransferase n=1 Tax=Polaromonas sp. CG_9.11 TaxID=2787730 RepID=UPI0018C95992|nr:putative N-acyltransferase [Polaromonas sp. CG_9.11]